MTDARVLKAKGVDGDPAIQQAAELLRAGEVVAFPTETVYGLGASALDGAAIAKIYLAKGRPAQNPLIVHVADVDAARALAAEWPESATKLSMTFWPGPLTLVLRKRNSIPDLATAGLPTVALRVPSHPVALALLRAVGIPIAAPSANRSEAVSPTTAEHVAESLGDRIALILDGGPTDVGIESTVVDLTGPVPRLLRPGMITREGLEGALGVSVLDAAAVSGDAARSSPGQLDRHYAPTAPVQIFTGRPATIITDAGAIVYTPGSSTLGREIILPADPQGYARGLYAALHTLDAARVPLILIEAPPKTAAWDAIRDRIGRASHT